MLSCGDTVLIQKSIDAKPHLYIVITHPEPMTGKTVWVNITTLKACSDTTVILRPGDHPFITHESVVYYIDAQEVDLNAVQQALDARMSSVICSQHVSCRVEVLEKIQQGLLTSKMTPRKVKEYCRRAWGIPS